MGALGFRKSEIFYRILKFIAAKRPKRDHVYPVLIILVKTLLEIRSAALLEAKNASDKETFLKEVEVEVTFPLLIRLSYPVNILYSFFFRLGSVW